MKLNFAVHPPSVPRGFPLEHVQFSGGRTGMTIADHGRVVDLLYYGRQSLGGASLFHSGFAHSSWPKLFRTVLEVDGRAHYPGFQDTRFYPFGYETGGRFRGVAYRFQIFLLNDALVQRILILSNPECKVLRLKTLLHGFLRADQPFRSWAPWTARSGGVVTACLDVIADDSLRAAIAERKKNPVQHITFENTDVGRSETHVGVISTHGLSHQATGGVHEGFKHYFLSGEFVDDAAMAVCFHSENAGLVARMDELSRGASAECSRLVESYASRVAMAPRIEAAPPVFRSCLENIPPLLDSLKVQDLPGAMRAAAHGYWVWSWDNLVYPEAHLFAGDASFVRDLLRFVIRHADPALGIPHQFNTQFTPQMAMAFPVQCLFITTLYAYYCHTEDTELLHEAMPLAAWIISKCRECLAGDTGLVEGTSLYPDYPGLLGQDGRDLSVFNNSVYYQGTVALEFLARKYSRLFGSGTFATLAEECHTLANNAREGFLRHFFDSRTGYFFDSVSASDFSPRKHYPVYAILWTTPFAEQLLGSHADRIARFMSANFTRPHGLGMFPVADKAWMCDGNQCGAYYPVVEPFFRQVMKLAGRARELKTYVANVSWFWRGLTIPEGLTYDTDDELPDNPGCKQAFAAKAWLGIFYGSILGLEPGLEGLAVRPGPFVMETSVGNILIRGKRIDVRVSGSSGAPRTQWNGRKFEGVIPYEEMEFQNELIIHYQ